MKRLYISAALLCCTALPAQAMTVAEFLAKAKALQARGLFAFGSPDIKLLKGEMKVIVGAYRAELIAARDAGHEPHSCPSERKATAEMNARTLIAELEKIPHAQRQMSMKAAFYGIMKRRYPCA